MPGAAITEFREAVKALVTAEFTAEGFPVKSDKLADSVGHDGPMAAVYPEREAPGESGVSQAMLVVVQVYNRYELNVDEYQTVDPAVIEGWAWRLLRSFKGNSSPSTNKVWWFNVAMIEYPDDPTGNKTRFLMHIEGHAPNAQLEETIA